MDTRNKKQNKNMSFEKRVFEKIEELIEKGLADVGTDEETVLFSQYVAREISYLDVREKLYADAEELVNQEIIEERCHAYDCA